MTGFKFFFPLEINFNNFYNTYFVTSVSTSFTFRSFQPKFYEFIKLRTISITSGFRSPQYQLFTSFQNPSNIFKPSLFSPFLQKEEFFNHDRLVFFKMSCSMFPYPFKPFFFNFFNNFIFFNNIRSRFFPYKYSFVNAPFGFSFYSVKFNFPKILNNHPYHYRNIQIFSTLPVNFFRPSTIKFSYSFTSISAFKPFSTNFHTWQFLNFYFKPQIFPQLRFFKFYFSNTLKFKKLFSMNNFFEFDDLYFSIFTPFTRLGVSKFYDQIFLVKRFKRKLRYTTKIPIFSFKNFSKNLLILKRSLLLKKYLNLKCHNLIFLIFFLNLSLVS